MLVPGPLCTAVAGPYSHNVPRFELQACRSCAARLLQPAVLQQRVMTSWCSTTITDAYRYQLQDMSAMADRRRAAADGERAPARSGRGGPRKKAGGAVPSSVLLCQVRSAWPGAANKPLSTALHRQREMIALMGVVPSWSRKDWAVLAEVGKARCRHVAGHPSGMLPLAAGVNSSLVNSCCSYAGSFA